jgi:hypothetical protein
MVTQPKNSLIKSIYLILLSLLFMGCKKADLSPTNSKKISTIKVDTLKSVSYSPDTDTSNPDYWYNGTKGTALIRVICKDCSGIATIGNDTTPFMFNEEGVGFLKYTPKTGMSIYLAICPGGVKTIKADIFNANNASLFTYSGVITANWLNTFVIK